MKPTSVIFLIVSVMLAAVGVLLCFTASNMANEQGVALFTQTGDANNNYSTVKEFDSQNIKKIVLKMSDVDVNIIGGADECRIELVNFPDGTYDYSVNKSTIQLNDNTAISNLIDIDNFKINFNGFRDYLHYYRYKDKPKVLNLYLSDDAAVIILKATTDGNVTMENLRADCDYRVTVKKGNVSLTNVHTQSSVSIESTEDSNIDVTNLVCNDLEINGVTAYAKIRNTTFSRSLYANVKSGDVDYDRVESDFYGFKVMLRADSGVIKCYDQKIINGLFEEDNRVDGPSPLPADPSEGDEDTDDEETGAEETESTEDPLTDAYSISITVNEGNIEIY